MVEHTIAKTAGFEGEIEVRYSGGNYTLMQKWLGSRFLYREQIGASLGDRLNEALATAFREMKSKVVIIGTDCPGLTTKHINGAFHLLERNDLVIGPALDGGYYLIGLKKLHRELFKGITWGTNTVYRQSIETAKKLNLTTATLEKLADVDRPADLPVWLNTAGSKPV